MSTNEFARILLTWIKSFLSWIGIPRDRLNELDEIIFLIRHYKIFCVNGNTGFRNESRIFYFIHL
uniref:hypothetical protein n=1 Tax=Phocaeicola vulgatus TaxID=821 RepID=UPI001E30C1C3